MPIRLVKGTIVHIMTNNIYAILDMTGGNSNCGCGGSTGCGGGSTGSGYYLIDIHTIALSIATFCIRVAWTCSATERFCRPI